MKKFLSVILSLCFVLSVCTFGDITVYAYTSGDYKYTYDQYFFDDGSYIECVRITKYTGSEKNVVVPSKIGTYPVIKVDYDTFKNNSSIESVTFSEGIKLICFDALCNCKNLEKVVIPASVTDIDYYDDGYGSFIKDCDNLKTITVSKSNKKYTSLDGVLYNKNMTELIYYPKGKGSSFILPPTVKKISCLFPENFDIALFSAIADKDISKIYGARVHTNKSAVKKQCNNYVGYDGQLNCIDIDEETYPTASGYSANSLTLSFSKSEAISGFTYTFYMYDSSTKKYKKLYSGKKRTCKVSGLKGGKVYSFKVKKRYSYNGKVYYESDAIKFKAATISKNKSKLNKQIENEAFASLTKKKFSNQFLKTYDSYDDIGEEQISDISQFSDKNGKMYFAYVSEKGKLVVKRLKEDLSTSTVFTAKKSLKKLGTIVTDGEGYFYALWGNTDEGDNKKQTAYKVVKYDSKGKVIKTLSYTRGETNAYIPFSYAGNCDAKIVNGTLYFVFTNFEKGAYSYAATITVNAKTMKPINTPFDFYCNSSTAQRLIVDKTGTPWCVNQGTYFPPAFYVSTPTFNYEAAHYFAMGGYGTSSALGNFAETSRGMFLTGAIPNDISEEGFQGDLRNVFITSADGSFKLKGASTRKGKSNEGDKLTDNNIKWLTNYKNSRSNTITKVQTVSTDDDRIVVLYKTSSPKNDYTFQCYYMILDANGEIWQKPVEIQGCFNEYETPLYKNGCVYWVADYVECDNERGGGVLYSDGIYLFKLDINKVKKPSVSISSLKSDKQGQITVSWGKKKNISGYEIQCSRSRTFNEPKKTTAKSSNTKATIKNLKAGKKYYVRMRTYKVKNGKKTYSSWSKVKTVTTKK